MAQTCERLINLSTPSRVDRVRGFQPPWQTVYVYKCECGAERRVRAGSFCGSRAVPSVGAIVCGATLASPTKRPVTRTKCVECGKFSTRTKLASGATSTCCNYCGAWTWTGPKK